MLLLHMLLLLPMLRLLVQLLSHLRVQLLLRLLQCRRLPLRPLQLLGLGLLLHLQRAPRLTMYCTAAVIRLPSCSCRHGGRCSDCSASTHTSIQAASHAAPEAAQSCQLGCGASNADRNCHC